MANPIAYTLSDWRGWQGIFSNMSCRMFVLILVWCFNQASILNLIILQTLTLPICTFGEVYSPMGPRYFWHSAFGRCALLSQTRPSVWVDFLSELVSQPTRHQTVYTIWNKWMGFQRVPSSGRRPCPEQLLLPPDSAWEAPGALPPGGHTHTEWLKDW